MREFGLIGFPLSHSFSKKFFSEKFLIEQIKDCRYELFPMETVDGLTDLISRHENLCGLNVTIPHKLAILPFLNEQDDASTQIGAVNCIAIRRTDNGIWLKGYNTDAYGFEESLKPLLEVHHKKALILGDGGAARAVKYVLTLLKIPFLVVTRKPAAGTIPYADVTESLLKEYTLLINTTPLGMSPDITSCPDLPYQYLSDQHLCYDLVYNPEETMFLTRSKAAGATIKNGLEMLYLQAERSWYNWNLSV